ncbi:hypothetical protein TRVA0_026S00540 [Trichomonascus vanleenenianus]|uniref:DNA-directed DNA polymerase IV n=1 Tax=Trichomonascus vanleenenianus TaxID=2268995 RepID=UPI003EC96DD9
MSTVAKRTRSGGTSAHWPSKKHETLFGGLVFTFVPEKSQSNVVRRKSKVFRSHGAKVVTDASKATHVLLPADWRAGDVEKHFKENNIQLNGNNDIVFVRDSWPSDCIDKGRVLKTDQYRLSVDAKELAATGAKDSKQDEASKDKVKADKEKEAPKEEEEPKHEEVEEHKGREEEEPKKEEDEEPKKEEDQISENEEGEKEVKSTAEKSKAKGPPPDETPKSANKDSQETKRFLKGTWHGYLHALPLSDSPNEHIIKIFTELMQHYEDIDDEWRMMSYRKAIATLKYIDYPVKTKEQAAKLTGIGDRLAGKIEVINRTGELPELEEARKDERGGIMAKFKKIFGVGPAIAREWYQKGYRTLDDIAKNADLNHAQKVGLEHYDDFTKPMSREVVKKHYDVFVEELEKVDKDTKTFLMGSYRRVEKQCNDIDIILTKPDAEMEELQRILSAVVEKLSDKGFIKAQLSTHSDATRWFGASAIEGDPTWRRIDVLCVPWEERGASLIYYTGNDLFNRSIRLLASRKGMVLNQKGLFKEPGGNGPPTRQHLIAGDDEKKIFEALGLEYREPSDRKIG